MAPAFSASLLCGCSDALGRRTTRLQEFFEHFILHSPRVLVFCHGKVGEHVAVPDMAGHAVTVVIDRPLAARGFEFEWKCRKDEPAPVYWITYCFVKSGCPVLTNFVWRCSQFLLNDTFTLNRSMPDAISISERVSVQEESGYRIRIAEIVEVGLTATPVHKVE